MRLPTFLLPLRLTLTGFALSAGALAAAEAGELPKAPPARPYPSAPVLAAFKEACANLSSLPAAEANVAARGWARATDPYATPVGPLVRFGYEQGRKMLEGNGKVIGAPTVFARDVAGETLYLIVSAVETGGTEVTGCRAYDPQEWRKIDPAEATRFAGRAPDGTVDRAELTKLTWEPGLAPGQDSFEIYHVPAGSPAIAVTKIAGIALKADRVGSIKR